MSPIKNTHQHPRSIAGNTTTSTHSNNIINKKQKLSGFKLVLILVGLVAVYVNTHFKDPESFKKEAVSYTHQYIEIVEEASASLASQQEQQRQEQQQETRNQEIRRAEQQVQTQQQEQEEVVVPVSNEDATSTDDKPPAQPESVKVEVQAQAPPEKKKKKKKDRKNKKEKKAAPAPPQLEPVPADPTAMEAPEASAKKTAAEPSTTVGETKDVTATATTTTNDSSNINDISNLRIAIYMTTHLSPAHLNFLEKCWQSAVQHLRLLQHSDLIVYTSVDLNNPKEKRGRILHNLGFKRPVQIWNYQNPGKQAGAEIAMVDPFRPNGPGNFSNYDWVIRLNPDVLIRRDAWLIEQMTNSSIDAITSAYPNKSRTKTLYQTDFYAFRPHAINGQAMVDHYYANIRRGKHHAETHITSGLKHIQEANRMAFIPNVERERKSAARMAGKKCDIIHVHSIVDSCPNYFNATGKAY